MLAVKKVLADLESCAGCTVVRELCWVKVVNNSDTGLRCPESFERTQCFSQKEVWFQWHFHYFHAKIAHSGTTIRPILSVEMWRFSFETSKTGKINGYQWLSLIHGYAFWWRLMDSNLSCHCTIWIYLAQGFVPEVATSHGASETFRLTPFRSHAWGNLHSHRPGRFGGGVRGQEWWKLDVEFLLQLRQKQPNRHISIWWMLCMHLCFAGPVFACLYTGYQWVRSLATYPWNRKSYLISFQETQFESYLISPIWCFKFSKKYLYFDVFWLKPQPPAHEIGVR